VFAKQNVCSKKSVDKQMFVRYNIKRNKRSNLIAYLVGVPDKIILWGVLLCME